jgi:CheY-like chemotaxis protein
MSHILLLEPNTLLAATYVALFKHCGYEATSVLNGQAAIQAADARTPDVVVCELQLGEHNGIEFLHEFRSYPEWRSIPVVVLTTLPPSRSEAYLPTLQVDLGVHEVLYKPSTSLADLLDAVRAQVARV